MTFCSKHNIFLLRLPAHTSHLTQPLDVGCFSPLKQYYQQAVKQVCRKGASGIAKQLFIDLYAEARSNAMTSANIAGVRSGAGLYPYNHAKVISLVNLQPTTPSNSIRLCQSNNQPSY